MEATATKPIKHHKQKELNPDDVKTSQPSSIDLGIPGEDGVFVRPEPQPIEGVGKPLSPDQATELLFNEEPVTIRAEMSNDPNAAMHIMASVNGKGAEAYIEGLGWQEMKWVPVGIDVIVKRKYLAVWLSSKVMSVTLTPDKADGSQPRNQLNRRYSQAYLITIVKDTPKGHEWARRLINQGR